MNLSNLSKYRLAKAAMQGMPQAAVNGLPPELVSPRVPSAPAPASYGMPKATDSMPPQASPNLQVRSGGLGGMLGSSMQSYFSNKRKADLDKQMQESHIKSLNGLKDLKSLQTQGFLDKSV